MNNRPPIFIVGVHRSGTTLLRYMLSSSPNIYIPPESDFIPRFFRHQPEEILSKTRVAWLLQTIFQQYRFVREWSGAPPESDEFYRQLGDPTPAGFLSLLYGTYAGQNDAVRWGDKTPIYASYMDLIAQIFPEAQFIHILRDGRDVALSMLDKWGKKEFHVDTYFAARNWVRRIRQAQSSGALLGPDRYYEIRYEQLVTRPEEELRQLCDFLGEVYIPQLAQPQILSQQSIQPGSFHDPVRKPPSGNRIDRWTREMSQQDLRLFQRVAGELLTELGYELADVGTMTLPERLRYAALSAKYTVLQSGRRVLQSLGVVPPI